MEAPVCHIIRNNHFWLSAQRCLYWEETQTLILADLHFGKTGHFRKAGIAIPQTVYKKDLQRLVTCIQYFQPQQLLIVGDLFHSAENKELDWFLKWQRDISPAPVHLVKGNHDILHDEWYREAGMTVYDEELFIKDFVFRHDPVSYSPSANNPSLYYFSGHLHPGISIRGLARQSLHFPCFYFTENQCVLPAFSHFTGTYSIAPKKGETVFAIVKESLIRVA